MIWDHLFVVIVFVVYPLYAKFTFKREIERIRAAGEPARVAAYRETILTWLIFTGIVILLWWLFGRDWTNLGFMVGEPLRQGIAVVVAIVAIAVFVLPLRTVAMDASRHGETAEQLGDLGVLMPSSQREQRWFTGVSVNAGVTEEIVFRGYLIWYLQHFVSLYWAAAIAVLLFGFAHMYQGAKQLPGILVVSAVATFLYVYTGSLLVPILFHAALDALQGRYLARIKR